MAHTYVTNYIHCIFSTKERRPVLDGGRLNELFKYLGGIAKGEGFTLVAAGGTANHIHLLFTLPAAYPLADAVQKLKGSSSRWLGNAVSWQQGYGAFSVSPSQVPIVKKYIQHQEERHRRRNFEEEFTALLKQCGIDFDPRHVFG